MKICILSIVNIKHMSAASLYFDYFKKNGIKYDIIYIDKYKLEEKTEAENVYKFNLYIKKDWGKGKKILSYFKFRKFAKRVLKENNYDLVITWGTETAFLFFDYLLKYLRNKYIINIRDYANLNSIMKFNLLKIIVNNSKLTTISSLGFKKFLPKYDYVLVHSLNSNILNSCNVRNKLRKDGEAIKICFIGNVRFYDNDKKLLKALKNDKRFIIQYFGVGSELLESYCKENGISNVEFINAFDLSETSRLLDKADIINNLYGYNEIALDTAVSIKYYYAVKLKIPLLVYKGTFMEEVSREIAFVFDDDYIDLGNRIYSWYTSISFNELSLHCNKKLESINLENREFYLRLKAYTREV